MNDERFRQYLRVLKDGDSQVLETLQFLLRLVQSQNMELESLKGRVRKLEEKVDPPQDANL